MTGPEDIWDEYRAEVHEEHRSLQGAIAFAFWRGDAAAREEIAKKHDQAARRLNPAGKGPLDFDVHALRNILARTHRRLAKQLRAKP